MRPAHSAQSTHPWLQDAVLWTTPKKLSDLIMKVLIIDAPSDTPEFTYMSCTLHICCCRSQGKLHSAEDGAAKSNDKGRDGCCESEVQCSALNEL